MLGDIVPKLGVSWVEAEAAARFAAAKPREWIEHNTHSLMLRQAGRQMLNEQVGPDGGVEGDLSLLKTPKSQENIEFSAPQS